MNILFMRTLNALAHSHTQSDRDSVKLMSILELNNRIQLTYTVVKN